MPQKNPEIFLTTRGKNKEAQSRITFKDSKVFASIAYLNSLLKKFAFLSVSASKAN